MRGKQPAFGEKGGLGIVANMRVADSDIRARDLARRHAAYPGLTEDYVVLPIPTGGEHVNEDNATVFSKTRLYYLGNKQVIESNLFKSTSGHLNRMNVEQLAREMKLDAGANRRDNIPLLQEFALRSDWEWHSLISHKVNFHKTQPNRPPPKRQTKQQANLRKVASQQLNTTQPIIRGSPDNMTAAAKERFRKDVDRIAAMFEEEEKTTNVPLRSSVLPVSAPQNSTPIDQEAVVALLEKMDLFSSKMDQLASLISPINQTSLEPAVVRAQESLTGAPVYLPQEAPMSSAQDVFMPPVQEEETTSSFSGNELEYSLLPVDDSSNVVAPPLVTSSPLFDAPIPRPSIQVQDNHHKRQISFSASPHSSLPPAKKQKGTDITISTKAYGVLTFPKSMVPSDYPHFMIVSFAELLRVWDDFHPEWDPPVEWQLRIQQEGVKIIPAKHLKALYRHNPHRKGIWERRDDGWREWDQIMKVYEDLGEAKMKERFQLESLGEKGAMRKMKLTLRKERAAIDVDEIPPYWGAETYDREFRTKGNCRANCKLFTRPDKKRERHRHLLEIQSHKIDSEALEPPNRLTVDNIRAYWGDALYEREFSLRGEKGVVLRHNQLMAIESNPDQKDAQTSQT